jgi:Spy/CpxP family protein refolding chaperone
MKRKLLAAAIGMAMVAMPLMLNRVQAEPTPLASILSTLELTQQQQTQLMQRRSQTQQQVENILNPAQREQLKTITAQGQQLKQAIAALNLSAEQKAQLRQVMQSARTDFSKMLTPQQKQKIQQTIRAKGIAPTPF